MRHADLIHVESADSSFVTLKVMQGIAVGALVAALVAGRLEVILLAALLVASVNVARLWCRAAARGCSLHAGVSRSRLYPGEELAITVEARNRKLLPIWVRTAVPDASGAVSLSGDRRLAPEAREPLLAGETGLLAFQQVTWEQRVVVARRGVYELGPVRLDAGDLLGFFRHERRGADRLEVIVYPRLVPLVPLALPMREFFGSRKLRTPVEDPVRPAGTRDYLGNRPARHIHWKASARLGRLQEKIYEPTAQASVLFLLDALSFPAEEPGPQQPDAREATPGEEAFERTLEVVASLAVELERARVPVGLAVNGALAGRADCILAPGRGQYQLSSLLEMLARVTRRANGAEERFSGRGLLVGGTTTCLYVCSSLTHARALAIEALREHLRSPFVVLHAELPAHSELPEVARLEREALQRTVERLRAAGIRTVRIAELAAERAAHG